MGRLGDSWLISGILLLERCKAGCACVSLAVRWRDNRKEIISFWGGHGRPLRKGVFALVL